MRHPRESGDPSSGPIQQVIPAKAGSKLAASEFSDVIPAKAGIQASVLKMDSRFRGNDEISSAGMTASAAVE